VVLAVCLAVEVSGGVSPFDELYLGDVGPQKQGSSGHEMRGDSGGVTRRLFAQKVFWGQDFCPKILRVKPNHGTAPALLVLRWLFLAKRSEGAARTLDYVSP